MKIEETVTMGKVEGRAGAIPAADQELAREQEAARARSRTVQRRSQVIRLAIRRSRSRSGLRHRPGTHHGTLLGGRSRPRYLYYRAVFDPISGSCAGARALVRI